MNSKPNIVLIQADQLTSQVLPMYGSDMAVVPNIKSLADTGITFLNSYCNNPVCGPSRASMISGQLSSSVECYDNACLLYTSPSPRDATLSRMPSSA